MMWEQIRANRTKTAVLVIAMAALLVVLGAVIGESIQQGFGLPGAAIAALVWFVMSLVAYFQGDRILLATSGARKIEKADHPQLFNVVDEMRIASGFSHMPDIYIINDESMNAFATGRKPDRCAVAVTSGLLSRLNRDELQGVMAHEVAHIVNRDVLLMSMLGVLLGAIVIIAEFYLRTMFNVGHSSRRYGSSSSSKREGGGNGPMVVIAIICAILAPLLAQLIYFAVSRRREYLADASAAVYTRYPEGLASALERLGNSAVPVRRANRATAAMYIINPFAKAKLTSLTSTHPPTAQRIDILRKMGGRVSYAKYQQAWAGAAGRRSAKIPGSALRDDKAVNAREADPASKAESRSEQVRAAGDALRKLNGFMFIPCMCGLKVKMPPDFKKPAITCPKCQRVLAVPVAQVDAAQQIIDKIHGGKVAETAAAAAPGIKTAKARDRRTVLAAPLSISRKQGEWQSFKCACGKAHTLSPGMLVDEMTCSQCKRTITLKNS